MEFWIILVISLPIFYIYGIYCFIRNIIKANNRIPETVTTSSSFKEALLKELAIQAEKNPSKTVKELLEEYSSRSGISIPSGLTASHTEYLQSAQTPYALPVKEKTFQHTKPKDDFFATWYSNNSINLLLYIGAFLIISAAGIFVSFQWETIPGVIKALLMTLVGVSFFGSGWYFYSIPKIKNAGSTFIAIAAILIPVIGSAWYTFVFKDAGIPVGIAWLLTSTVALTAYISLALYMRSAFYAYAATISTFSLMLSVVNTADLNKNFYLLAGIISCFVLQGIRYFVKNLASETQELFGMTTDLSSQIAMPIILVYGFITGISEDILFSMEGTLSAFLAAAFYFVSYKQTQQIWQYILCQILFVLSMLFGLLWMDVPDVTSYYFLSLTGLSIVGLGYYSLMTKQTEEADVSFVVGTTTTIITFIWGFFADISPYHQALLALMPIAASGSISYLRKNAYPLLITSSFFALFLYIVYAKILGYEAYPQYLGLLYLIQAVLRYMLTFALSKRKETLDVGHITIVSYSVLAMFLTIEHLWLFLITTSVISFMLFSTSILQKAQFVSLGGVFFALVSYLLLFHQLHTPLEYYPLLILLFSYIVFFAGRAGPTHLRDELRSSSLLISSFSCIYYFITTMDSYTWRSQQMLERNALISAYGTNVLFVVDYLTYGRKPFAYVTSFVALCTLLWQIYYLGFTDALMYTTPLGLYFMAVGYTRRNDDLEQERVLSGIGMFLLLASPFFLSFGIHQVKYSLILFVESVLFVFAGISLRNILYRYAGFAGIVLAILPQTYNYILSLPRWVVVGILGLAFLAFAIFLLLKRKEE